MDIIKHERCTCTPLQPHGYPMNLFLRQSSKFKNVWIKKTTLTQSIVSEILSSDWKRSIITFSDAIITFLTFQQTDFH